MESLINNNMVSTNAGLPEERGWEYKQISVTRVQGFGFGIAVSGGRDNPHFASGDPSIAVSDVLAAGPAERMLQVNDRIISVNGISLQNVDYATAVQVLRDSGDTVTLVVKRRKMGAGAAGGSAGIEGGAAGGHGHQHSLSGVSSYVGGPPLAALGINSSPGRVTLTKSSKKEDFGIVLGCRLFIKEISSKARDQLLNTNQSLQEGDYITKINNTNCNELMSLKEAKKIIDSTKDKLHLGVSRENNQLLLPSLASNYSHQTQSSVSTTGAVNNFYKGDDFLTAAHQSYSNQNLYVQPPTRNNANLNTNGFDDKMLDATMTGATSPNNSASDDKSNLAPRSGIAGNSSGGRSRNPLSEANLAQMQDPRNSANAIYGRSKGPIGINGDEPPRPPPPRIEDYYSSRRQLYDEDPVLQKTKQPVPAPRYITFHKEGSVGIRLTGGNFVGIFVTAVQPGSPASLQGLQPGDKILKVNDMDMAGVTREEAVLYLLSLQDRIELIVQLCHEEYESIVSSQKGDSFYIKTHFHYESPAKGEMSFRSGDIFHVIDTLYNGVVGCWQVFRIGRNNQEVQKGIIPNKARAEELATAQFNATKKEMSANESRGSFFKRRRSNNRRSKSLGKEHWDDILFSDTMSKFPAYERVVLKHPGFTRPVIVFGPISDLSRDKLLKDYPDKFISPQLDNNLDESKTKVASNIIKLSAIREVISTGKHALLDITPNAVERLNYAQLYPIVIFFKAEAKIVIKQLRQGLPKSAHKSSKKLLEQCQKLDKVWNYIFCSTITLSDNTDGWYRKIREIIDKQQSGPIWISESKPEECLSDDFLFPMSSLRLSYASSPESDLEHSPGPSVGGAQHATNTTNGDVSLAGNPGSIPPPGRLTKASSDPSVVMPDSSSTDMLPPYQPAYDTRYGFNSSNGALQPGSEPQTPTTPTSKDSAFLGVSTQHLDMMSPSVNGNNNNSDSNLYNGKPPAYSANGMSPQALNFEKNDYPKTDPRNEYNGDYNGKSASHKRQSSNVMHNAQFAATNHMKGLSISDHQTVKDSVYGSNSVPDLPPRIDRAVKPLSLNSTPSKSNGRSAHERLFGTKASSNSDHNDQSTDSGYPKSSLDRNHNSKSDSLSSYDSFGNPSNKHVTNSTSRIIPNAHDDLKTTLSKIDTNLPTSAQSTPTKYQRWEQQQAHSRLGSKLDLKYGGGGGNLSDHQESPRNSREMDKDMDGSQRDVYGRYTRSPGKAHVETKTDYGKYSRNNQQEYSTRSSHQDLSQSHLSIHQPSKQQHMGNGYGIDQQTMSGTGTYKPVPPPKPKNYKPPHKGNGNGATTHSSFGPSDGIMQPPLPYQHNKSHSNPVENQQQQIYQQQQQQRPNSGVMQLNTSNHNNYYYNMPGGQNQHHQQQQQQQQNGPWHTETAVRYNTTMHSSPFEMGGGGAAAGPPGTNQNQVVQPASYHQDAANVTPSRRHHANISYASRSEIAPIAQQQDPMHYDPNMMHQQQQQQQPMYPTMNSYQHPHQHHSQQQSSIVDLQGSREQRGSAFELYRKPLHHNMRVQASNTTNAATLYGSQPNLANSDAADLDGEHLYASYHPPQYPHTPIYATNNNNSATTTSTKNGKKLSKAQSFRHQKSEGLSTPKFLRRMFGGGKSASANTTPKNGGGAKQLVLDRKLSISEPRPMSIAERRPILVADMRMTSTPPPPAAANYRASPGARHSMSPSPAHSSSMMMSPMLGGGGGADVNRNTRSSSRAPSHGVGAEYMHANGRDVTSAIVDAEGATLINHYWGVSLEIPAGAIPHGRRQEVYFVITDPRTCDNAPPLDLDNGETMLSPLVMCGPQGLEFCKPVILNIPHYANTLPSLAISLKATDSETDICTDWDNILLPSNHAANSVAVKVDHF